MSVKKVFPETTLKTVDVIAAKGALNVGCYILNGEIVPTINSVKTLNVLADKVSKAWYSADKKKYAAFVGEILRYSDGVMDNPPGMTMRTQKLCMVETCVNGANAAVFIGDNMYFYLGSRNAGRPFRGAVHDCVAKNGRIFGIDNEDPYKIVWSGEGGLEDWNSGISGAGWVIVQNGYGEILNLVVYKEKIVVLRECGLTVFTAYGTPENYKLSYLERKLPKIYKNTAAVVGTELLFYTEDGLYVYDGNKVEKSCLPLADEMQSPTWVTCFGGKYFLLGESKTLARRVIFVFDSILNTACLIDFGADAIAVGDRVFAYSDLQEYELEDGGEYAFISGEIDFSSNGVKVLKEVILDGAKDIKIEVSNGVISRIVGGVRGKFRPNMRGKSFKITVCGKGKIEGISAVAEVIDGV